ncbi:hypothetical protein BKA64DRAFT_703243 [Cadophora sp. MPI-SDFR-AT-0126]|nr:hypothetical protein BKA64DRAFT_703243 [Leotiomycetes sp. MPI-SDFR-AT-0126]
MSSSKVAQIRTYTIASPSSHTQPPNQQFSSSLPASSQSTPTTEVHSTCNYDAHKQRHQKRTKEDGRRFPTPRPRYNSDGKKVKQGGSYPYPSGGNRLPFLKKDDEDGTVLEEVGEVEVVSGCGQDHGRGDDRGRRDASTSTEMNMVKDKGKGKEKVEQKWRADDTRAEPHHNQRQQERIHECSLTQNWEEDEDQADIEYARSIEHCLEGTHFAPYQLVRIANGTSRTSTSNHRALLILELNVPVPFDEPEDIYVLSNLVTMSTRYSPWSEFDGTAGCEINDMKHCVAGLERFVSRFPGFSATRIKSNHEHLKYLDAEHARIIRELSVVRELQDPLVRFLEAMRMHGSASPPNFDGNVHVDEEKIVTKEAKAQLEEYNKRWELILSRVPTTASQSTALALAISIPYPALSDTSSSFPSSPSTPSAPAARATHSFFCHAFNLTPRLDLPSPSSPCSPPKPAFYASGARESQIRDLMGLRRQLKMEKVR